MDAYYDKHLPKVPVRPRKWSSPKINGTPNNFRFDAFEEAKRPVSGRNQENYAYSGDAIDSFVMEEFDDFCYFKKDLIGHGAFAIVYKGHYKSKNVEVAIKAIAKKNISKTKSLLTKEIRILKELSGLKHENLVTLLKCVEEPSHVYLVMEYCNGGDLGDYLNAKEKIGEVAIRHFFSQIACALEAMNMKDIVHRDLKPQNILLCNPHKMTDIKAIQPTDLVVKLADFGFARFLTGDGMAGTLCGSPMYMAPEVIMSLPYCAKADLWSVGTIMYQCLVGKAPFIAQTPQALKQFYERNKELRPILPSHCSPELADLLLRLLKRNSRDRMEFADFFAHPFFRKPSAASDDDFSTTDATVAQKLMRNDAHYYANASPTHAARSPIRAKFSAAPPPLASPRDHYYATIAPTSSAAMTTGNHHHQLHQQQHTAAASSATPRFQSATGAYAPSPQQPRAEAAFTRQPGGPSLRYTATSPRLGNAGERQAPLRPLSQVNSPSVVRRAIPSNVAMAHNTYNVSNEVASDAGHVRKGMTKAASMVDSSDFTFLPPLSENIARYPTMNDGSTSRRTQLQLQFSNASSTVSGENPVKQVQVHITAVVNNADDRGDPVPSQRFAYAQMQERRKMSTGNAQATIAGASPQDEKPKTLTFERRLPSVEEINLPETKFLVHEPPRVATRSNLLNGVDSTIKSKLRASMTECGIPKSATYSEFTKHTSTNSPGVTRRPAVKETTSNQEVPIENSSDADTSAVEEKRKAPEYTAPRASTELTMDDDDEENAMEESTMSQVMDSITGDEELATLRRAQRSSSTTVASQQQHHSVLRNSNDAAAAAADLLFFNNTVAGAEEPPPPELEAETVLDNEHRQTLAKLQFVLELIETLINVAEKKTNPMAMIMEGGTRKSSRQQTSGSTSGSGSSEVSRRAEQLVLYVRSLHVLSSALVMAQRQIAADTLKPSPAVQTVLNQLNEKYHHCLSRSQELASLGIPGMDPSMCVISAERIMYQHAIDLCQSAALDELFGHPQLCPKRYQTAYMMLHTLYEQVQNEQDKHILAKYKSAVEKRMRILEQQGFVTAVNVKADDPVNYSRSHFNHGFMPRTDYKNILREEQA